MIVTKMKKLLFGEIVLLKFPYTNDNKFKKRPALILADTVDGDIIVCRITSRLYNTEFDFEVKYWKESGLILPSVVRLHKIASLEKSTVEKIIGVLNESLKTQLQEKFISLLK